MEDYNKVLEATSVAENANGVAAEKMTVYNESLEAAQNRLTASVQQFAQDSNLDRTLALAYDGLSKVVEILNILLNKIPVLSPLIKAFGVALATAFAGAIIKNMITTSEMLKGIVSAAPGVVSAFAKMAAGAGTFGAVVEAAGGPVTIILSVLSALIAIAPAVASAWKKMFPSAEERLNKSTQELNEANSKLEETKNQIQEIQDKIDAINSKDSLTIADEAEKDKLQEQLDTLEQIKKVQEDIAKTKKGQALTDTQGLVTSEYSGGKSSDEYFADLEKKSTSTRGRYAGKLTVTYDAESASVQQLIANLKYLDEQKKNLNETDSTYQEDLDKINQLESENNSQLLTQKQTLLGYKQTLIEAGDTSSEAYQLITNLIDQINIALDPSSFGKIKISELIDDSGYDGVLSNLHDKAVSAVQKAGEDSSQEAQTQAQQAMSQLDGYITTEANKIAEKIANDEDLKNQFAEWLNIDPNKINVDQIVEVVKQQLQQAYGVSTEAANTATAASNEYNASLTTTSELADQVSQSEVDLANDTKSLSDAYNAMIKNGKITKAQMAALIKQYPELTDAIEVQNGVIRVNTEVLQEKYQQVIKTHDQVIQDQIDETNKVIEQTKQRIKAYEAEITALQTVQLSRNVFVDTGMTDSGDLVAGSSQSIEGAGGNRFGSKSSIQSAIDEANKQLEEYQKNLELLMGGLHTGDKLSYTGSSSGSSAADKAAKKFEDTIKDRVKNLKSIVDLYSEQQDWDDPTVIQKYTDDYNNLLNEVINNPKARQVLADSFNLDISKMSDEEAIENLTTLWKKQAGTIDEAYQKLSKNALNEMDKASKAREKEYEDAVKNIESLQKMTVNMIETAIDLFQKAGDIVFSLIGKLSKKYDKQIDALDAQMDNLDKIADNLDKQKDAFDDKIDAQKEMLKLQKEEMDNADELAEKNKSIADIDAQLMELQYDDSAEAQAKRLKLLDERAQKEKDLSDYQKDQAYDTKVNALDREKDAYDKNIEAQKKYIEAQKEALKEQQDAIKAAQDKFEQNLSRAQNIFNGFVKVISSNIFKNLAANLLDSLDGKTLQKVLTAWNRWFGDGLESTVKNTWDKAYASADWLGWKKGSNISDILNIGKQGQQTEKDVQSVISDALAKNESGPIDFNSYKKQIDSLTSAFDGFKKNALSSIKQVSTSTADSVKGILQLGEKSLDKMVSSGNGLVQTIGKGIKNTIGISKNGVSSVYNSVTQMLQATSRNGVSSITMLGANGQGVLSSLGQMAYNLLGNLGNYASQTLNMFTQGSGGVFSTIGNLALKAINGVGGVASKAFSAVTGIGGKALGVITSMGSKALGAVAGVGGKVVSAIGSAAGALTGGAGLAGAAGTLATGGLIGAGVAAAGYGIYSSVKNIKNAWSDPNRSTLSKIGSTLWNISPVGMVWNAGKGIVKGIVGIGKKIGGFFKGLFHHSGSDYVKKEHPELDRMLGLKDDETVSILKVGEAVVPTWANSASSSASGSRYTGSPVSGIVSSAVKSARASMGTSNVSNNTNSSINISMPINIKGDADDSTVRALKDATSNIVNTVLRTINGQTRMGGYRNIKAATV